MANLASIFALQIAMGAIVGIYYLWPAGSAVLSRYALWQASGGVLGTGLVYAIAGGVLSELSFVCFQQRGRWKPANFENIGFKFILFFISGCMVYEFYRMQAIWWGTGATFSIIAHKVVVDQFGYTLFFAAPYYALLTRWQAVRYTGGRLWKELKGDFLAERLLPMLVTNWMFWIPAVSFVYAMPSVLQPPIAAFATAIWGLLVSAIGSQEPAHPAHPEPVAAGPAGSPPMVAAPVK